MRIGYARAFDDRQQLALQVEALTAAGCDTVQADLEADYLGNLPGGHPDRLHLVPSDRLTVALLAIGEGDVLVVCRLDRLGRSLAFLVELITWLEDHGAGLQSLDGSIDTTSTEGKAVIPLMRTLADADHILQLERTAEEAQGGGPARRLARPTLGQLAFAKRGIQTRENTLTQLASILGVDRSSLDRSARGYVPPEDED
ncbi:recombinase family protein [Geminicoccus roseus]|uniref:recombinase family protein n=1 Tax=Geminicoccus roseus TaxID=404900 RepID=UPI0003FAADB6|nr:recombinase family protein [Geminicoccus roseus]